MKKESKEETHKQPNHTKHLPIAFGWHPVGGKKQPREKAKKICLGIEWKRIDNKDGFMKQNPKEFPPNSTYDKCN